MAPIDQFIPFPSDRFTISDWFRESQDVLCIALEKMDGKGVFHEEHWQSKLGGGGRSRYMDNANCFEKASIHAFTIHGSIDEKAATLLHARPNQEFFLSGNCYHIFPHNPHIPDFHFEASYLELRGGGKWLQGRWWHNTISHSDKISVAQPPQLKQGDQSFINELHSYPFSHYLPGISGSGFLTNLEDKVDQKTPQEIIQTFFSDELNKLRLSTYEAKDQPYSREEKQQQLQMRGEYAAWTLLKDSLFKVHMALTWDHKALHGQLPPTAVWK